MKRLEEELEVDNVAAVLLNVGDIIAYNKRAWKVITIRHKSNDVEMIIANTIGDRRQIILKYDYTLELLWYGNS